MTPTAVFDRTFATHDDFAARFALHALLGITSRADDRPEKIVARVLVNRHDNFAPLALPWRLWLQRIQQALPLLLECLPLAHFARVDHHARAVKDGLWRWRPAFGWDFGDAAIR